MSPQTLAAAQQRFLQQCHVNGWPITAYYGGNWTRNPADGTVARAEVSPATVSGYAIYGMRQVAADAYSKERIGKWGKRFVPDGTFLLPYNVPTANLYGITNTSSGDAYDLILVPPQDFGEQVYFPAVVRSQNVYNRLVTVITRTNETSQVQTTTMVNMPCAFLTPGALGDSSVDMDMDILMNTEAYYMDVPIIYEGSGDLGSGITPQNAQIGGAGSWWDFNNTYTTVIDNPASYGQGGLTKWYKIAGSSIWPGGEFHHMRYLITSTGIGNP